MIILYVRIRRAVIIRSEGDAEISRQENGVAARPIAHQGMKIRSGIVHPLRSVHGFECRKNSAQLPCPLGFQTLCLTPSPIIAKRFVSNTSDHDHKMSALNTVGQEEGAIGLLEDRDPQVAQHS